MKMKLQPIFTNMYLFLVAVFILTTCYPSDKTASRDRLFDNGWKFLRDSITGAEAVDFDDAGQHPAILHHQNQPLQRR